MTLRCVLTTPSRPFLLLGDGGGNSSVEPEQPDDVTSRPATSTSFVPLLAGALFPQAAGDHDTRASSGRAADSLDQLLDHSTGAGDVRPVSFHDLPVRQRRVRVVPAGRRQRGA